MTIVSSARGATYSLAFRATDSLGQFNSGGVSVTETGDTLPAVSTGTLTLWLDAVAAATLAMSGSSVTTWTSRAASAHPFSQGTTANQPTLVANALNNLPGLRFAGAQFISTPSYNTSFQAVNTMFFVISGYTGGMLMFKGLPNFSWTLGGKKIWMGDGTTNESGVGLFPSFVGHSCDISTSIVGATASSPLVLCVSTRATNSIQYYLNGTLVYNNNWNLNIAYADPGSTLSIGGPNVFSTPFTGYVHEVAHYNAALSAADISSVSTFLRSKWNVPAFVHSPPSSSGGRTVRFLQNCFIHRNDWYVVGATDPRYQIYFGRGGANDTLKDLVLSNQVNRFYLLNQQAFIVTIDPNYGWNGGLWMLYAAPESGALNTPTTTSYNITVDVYAYFV